MHSTQFCQPRMNRRSHSGLRFLRFKRFAVRYYGRREYRKYKGQLLQAKVLQVLYWTIEARLKRFEVALADGESG